MKLDMKRLITVGEGNMQVASCWPSLSIQRITQIAWKFNIPPNKSIARQIFKEKKHVLLSGSWISQEIHLL